MTTPIVPSITDEQLAEIERFLGFGGSTLKLHTGPLRGLIARLRAAEKDAARYRFLKETDQFFGVKLDESIDAAMEQSK